MTLQISSNYACRDDNGRILDRPGSPMAAAIVHVPSLASFLDNRARTAIELAIIAGVRALTASAHLARLKEERLIKVVEQGRHHYYTLYNPVVAMVLEGLLALSGANLPRFVTKYPSQLRHARTCYDHMAGTQVLPSNHPFLRKGWLDADDHTLEHLIGIPERINNPQR